MNPQSSPPSYSRQDPPHVTIEIPNKDQKPNPTEQLIQTCPICTDDYPANEILAPLPCHHNFCSTCLKEYLSERINSNQVLNIRCPQSDCPEVFTDKILEGVLDPEMYKRYQTFVANKLALKGPRQHYCPNPRCSVLFTPQKSKKYTICSSCGTKICNRCDSAFHEGKSCLEAMDPDFAQYVKENGAKFCMVCKTIVERDGGCEHIVCSVCGYQWCWVCGRNYEKMHICKGIWDPVPPTGEGQFIAYVKRVKEEGPLLKFIGLVIVLILFSPFLLLGFLVLRTVGRVEVSKDRPMKSCCSIFCAIICAPIAWFIVFCAILVYALLFILMIPCMLIGLIIKCFEGPRQPTQEEQLQAIQAAQLTQPTLQSKDSLKTRDLQNYVDKNAHVAVPISN